MLPVETHAYIHTEGVMVRGLGGHGPLYFKIVGFSELLMLCWKMFKLFLVVKAKVFQKNVRNMYYVKRTLPLFHSVVKFCSSNKLFGGWITLYSRVVKFLDGLLF